MTIEDQITALLAEAEPLRCLSDEEAEAAGLPAIVDQINYLRTLQGKAEQARDEAEFAAVVAEVNPPEVVEPEPVVEPEKRRRGHPKKAE